MTFLFVFLARSDGDVNEKREMGHSLHVSTREQSRTPYLGRNQFSEFTSHLTLKRNGPQVSFSRRI